MSEQNAAKMDELGDPGPRIDQDIAALVPQLKEIRRHLHKKAELSFQEVETAAYILKRLQNIKGVEDISTGLGRAPPEFKGAAPGQIEYVRPESGTGITAYIKGNAGPGPCILLRAYIDALPILEDAPERDYSSQNGGVMHA